MSESKTFHQVKNKHTHTTLMSDLKHKLVVWEPTADGAVRMCVRKLYSCSGCDFVTQHLDMILDHIDTEETDQHMQELKLAAVQTPPQLEVKESMMAPDTKDKHARHIKRQSLS